MSLFDEVVSGAYTTEGYEGAGVSADVEAEIESYVTDDPFTVATYTGECFESMLAAEAALYAVEGRCAVKYATAAEESTKMQVQSTMEASLRGAWETIKDYASRAWEAVKKFIKKIWGKIKGYASVIRNYFSKYADVIRKKDTSGLRVKWQKINPEMAFTTLKNLSSKFKMPLPNELDNEGADFKDTEDDHTLFSNQDVRDDLYDAIYHSKNGYNPEETNFNSIKNEAVNIADLGYDKFFQGFLKFGDTKAKEFEANAKRMYSEAGDEMGKTNDSKRTAYLKYFRQIYKALMGQIQLCVSVMRGAIQNKYKLAVQACRKAVRYQAGDATASESAMDFQSMLAEIL